MLLERLQTQIGNRTDWLPVIMKKYEGMEWDGEGKTEQKYDGTFLTLQQQQQKQMGTKARSGLFFISIVCVTTMGAQWGHYENKSGSTIAQHLAVIIHIAKSI